MFELMEVFELAVSGGRSATRVENSIGELSVFAGVSFLSPETFFAVMFTSLDWTLRASVFDTLFCSSRSRLGSVL